MAVLRERELVITRHGRGNFVAGPADADLSVGY
jgi:DNA-binding GntR family transcriptional regulator